MNAPFTPEQEQRIREIVGERLDAKSARWSDTYIRVTDPNGEAAVRLAPKGGLHEQ